MRCALTAAAFAFWETYCSLLPDEVAALRDICMQALECGGYSALAVLSNAWLP